MDNLPGPEKFLSPDQLAVNGLDLIRRGGDHHPLRIHTPIGDVQERLRFLSRCNSGDVQIGNECIGENIQLVRWCVHKVQLAGDTPGEVLDRDRLVIESADGGLYSSLSPYCLDGLSLIVESLGPGPYDPPVTVHFSRTKTRQGRSVLLLIVGGVE